MKNKDELTVKEIKEIQQRLEKQLWSIVGSVCKETGLDEDDFSINYSFHPTPQAKTFNVSIII